MLRGCIQAPWVGASLGAPAALPLTHPRLPALDVLRLKDDLCLNCDFMIDQGSCSAPFVVMPPVGLPNTPLLSDLVCTRVKQVTPGQHGA